MNYKAMEEEWRKANAERNELIKDKQVSEQVNNEYRQLMNCTVDKMKQ